jgi:hypothetical protein
MYGNRWQYRSALATLPIRVGYLYPTKFDVILHPIPRLDVQDVAVAMAIANIPISNNFKVCVSFSIVV